MTPYDYAGCPYDTPVGLSLAGWLYDTAVTSQVGRTSEV